jgi:hypothetical protein
LSASAALHRPLVQPDFTASAAGAVTPLYSSYLKQNPDLQVTADSVGRVTIVRFLVGGSCPAAGCYTTVVTLLPNGNYRQIFAMQTPSIAYYATQGPFPTLRAKGLDWDYVAMYGYTADLKSAGQAFVPTQRPEGSTSTDIEKALSTSGWPRDLPPLVQEIQPGGGAPTTLMVIPDMTTKPGQLDCAADACHIWFLIYSQGQWVASNGTTGTGLLAVLPADPDGASRIGVAKPAGFQTYSWSASDNRWELTGSTFSKVQGSNQ